MKPLVLLLLSLPVFSQTFRINAGGPALTDSAGVAWSADQYGSAAYVTTETIPAGVSPIYSTKRYGLTFQYAIPAADGPYTVALYMIDTTSTAAGQRVFSAVINGAPALVSYDLVADVGVKVPTRKTFNVTAAGGAGITIAYTTGLKSAMVNAIEVLPVIPPSSLARPIYCDSGAVSYADLVNTTPTQEIVILSNIPGNRRWEQITICEDVRFLGQSIIRVSAGRPGTNDDELYPGLSLGVSGGDTNCATFRPVPPQYQGPYSIVLAFSAATAPGVPGQLSLLTSGHLTWEACHYDGIIGDPAVIGLAAVALNPTTAPASTVTAMDLTLSSPAFIQPAALQWSYSYPPGNVSALTVAAGPSLVSSGKQLSCAGSGGLYTCVAWGLNASVIPNGVVATLSVSTGAAPAAVSVGNALGASVLGDTIPVTSGAALVR